MTMDLKQYGTLITKPHPNIGSLREHFRTKDKSIFINERFVELHYIERARHLSSNVVKLFNAIEEQYPGRMNELIFYKQFVAPTGGIYLTYQGFYPPIKLLGTEEQVHKWTKLLVEGRIFGAYAQTEVGHGSDVQSLMTTATFNKERKTFVLNSPSTKSVKFWPGGLGWQATHVVCQAQTFINNKHYGLQTFVAPIRDTKTYKLYQGVEAGDIGPKLGYAWNDNGYLKFTNYEVPLDSLLMKFMTVKEDGTVSKTSDKNSIKIGYGGMLGLRVNLSLYFLIEGFRAVVISYRTLNKDGKISTLARRDLLNEMSYLYSNLLTIQWLSGIYQKFNKNVTENLEKALGGLNELHLLASGIKAYYSWRLIEQVRQATTKQSVGNLLVSGTINLYSDIVPTVTYEGDNVVMLQQTARGLCKFMQYLENEEFNKIPSSFRYLVNFREFLDKPDEIKLNIENPSQLVDLEKIEQLIGLISLFSLSEAYTKMKEKLMGGDSVNKTWNEQLQSCMINMATTIIRGMTFITPKKLLSKGTLQENLRSEDVKLLEKILIINGLNILRVEVNKMCQFKIGAQSDQIKNLLAQAHALIDEQIDNKLGYLIESHPFFEEELYYVRDYQKWSSTENDKDRVKVSMSGDLQKYVNTLSKL